MINFLNVKALTQDTSILPITVADVKAYSKFFIEGDPTDTSKDVFIEKMIIQAIRNWEEETGFLILDQTFKTSLYNQRTLYYNFKARLTRLNIRSIGDVLYHPDDWNNTDAKLTLSTDKYYFTEERDTDPAFFQLKEGVCYIELYPVYNNLEVTVTAGYEANDFTNLPSDIKDAIAMMTSDIVDADAGICGCEGFYSQEASRVYGKYTAYTPILTL